MLLVFRPHVEDSGPDPLLLLNHIRQNLSVTRDKDHIVPITLVQLGKARCIWEKPPSTHIDDR